MISGRNSIQIYDAHRQSLYHSTQCQGYTMKRTIRLYGIRTLHPIHHTRQALNYPVITSYKTGPESCRTMVQVIKLAHVGKNIALWPTLFPPCYTAHVASHHIVARKDTHFMITSSNGNIFRVTGHLCREFTGHRWIPRTKASYAELWCFSFICAWETAE